MKLVPYDADNLCHEFLERVESLVENEDGRFGK